MAKVTLSNGATFEGSKEECKWILAQDLQGTAKTKTSGTKAKKSADKEQVEEKRTTYKGVTTVSLRTGVRGGFVADHYEVGNKTFTDLDSAKAAAKKVWEKENHITAASKKAFASEQKAKRDASWKRHQAYLQTNEHFAGKKVSKKVWMAKRDEILATL